MTTDGPDDTAFSSFVSQRRIRALAAPMRYAWALVVAPLAVMVLTYAPPPQALALWGIAGVVLLSATGLVAVRVPSEAVALSRRWIWINGTLMAAACAVGGGVFLAAALPRAVDPTVLAICGALLLALGPITMRAAPVAAGAWVAALASGTIAALLTLRGQSAWAGAAMFAVAALALLAFLRADNRAFAARCMRDSQRHAVSQRIARLLDLEDALPPVGRGEQLSVIEEKVRLLVESDAVTGLPNRRCLLDRLATRIAAPTGDAPLAALLAIDLDGFRALTEVFGHRFGELAMHDLAARLRTECRGDDLLARSGEDGFAMMITAPAGDGMVIDRAHRVLAAVRQLVALDGQAVQLSAGIGIARWREGLAAEELVRRAEAALHAAKTAGRDRIALFDDAMDRRARDRHALEHDLRQALARDQMVLHYQPIVSLTSGAVVAYEALLRWEHPARGTLMPDAFLPLAEETGLIGALGKWVIRRALAEVADWPGDFRLAINLSPRQVRDPLLIADIDAALAIARFPPQRLELEITEHALFDDEAMLARLRALGTLTALDDFGTGYSSLSYLCRFRFHRVKIDRSFVTDLETRGEAQAIVAAITRLAAALGMHTTAEGVETPGQLELLRQFGCDEAQGYLMSKPLPADRIAARRATGAGVQSARA